MGLPGPLEIALDGGVRVAAAEPDLAHLGVRACLQCSAATGGQHGPMAATSSDAFAESFSDLLAPVGPGGPHALVVGEPINKLLEVHVHGRLDQAGVDVRC